eukprot:2272299-Prymnesium_polylepis.1
MAQSPAAAAELSDLLKMIVATHAAVRINADAGAPACHFLDALTGAVLSARSRVQGRLLEVLTVAVEVKAEMARPTAEQRRAVEAAC